MTRLSLALLLVSVSTTTAADITVKETADAIAIETNALKVSLRKTGYVSGTAAGTFEDKLTGAKDLGYGLHIMDFLLAPGWRDDDYSRNELFHGKMAKHYVEGPQICTKAKTLKPTIIKGKDFVAVQWTFTFTEPGKGYKAGSKWVQTLVFPQDVRYFISSEAITSANDVDNLFYRIDMPGHIKHKDGDTFNAIYLSYNPKQTITSANFKANFNPDAQYLYTRNDEKLPERMIRGYQTIVDGKQGPWLVGMTLDPAAVSEAWCHQRGYVCFIQELHKRKVKAGETFGAAYVVGWFDNVRSMETTYDKYKGAKKLTVSDKGWSLEK